MIKVGDYVKIEDIGPLAEVVDVRSDEAYLRLDGYEFWCPLCIVNLN